METPNYYDKKLTETGGDAIKNTYVYTGFVPFEKASENKATQDYLDIMKQYNPSGKVAALGLQSTSAFLSVRQGRDRLRCEPHTDVLARQGQGRDEVDRRWPAR